MEYHELGSLHDRLTATGPLPVADVVKAASAVADALDFAHSRGILHRDVKPQNVLVLPTSYVLADFGIARMADAGHTASLERFSYRHASPQVLDGGDPRPPPTTSGRSAPRSSRCWTGGRRSPRTTRPTTRRSPTSGGSGGGSAGCCAATTCRPRSRTCSTAACRPTRRSGLRWRSCASSSGCCRANSGPGSPARPAGPHPPLASASAPAAASASSGPAPSAPAGSEPAAPELRGRRAAGPRSRGDRPADDGRLARGCGRPVR